MKLIYDLAIQNKERLDKHDTSLVEHVNMIKEVDKRVGDLEKIAHNAMIWRIEDYNRKFKEAKGGNNDTLFSPIFTTSKHGYRLCASVCLNGDGKGKGTHMSIFVSVLKGKLITSVKVILSLQTLEYFSKSTPFKCSFDNAQIVSHHNCSKSPVIDLRDGFN